MHKKAANETDLLRRLPCILLQILTCSPQESTIRQAPATWKVHKAFVTFPGIFRFVFGVLQKISGRDIGEDEQ